MSLNAWYSKMAPGGGGGGEEGGEGGGGDSTAGGLLGGEGLGGGWGGDGGGEHVWVVPHPSEMYLQRGVWRARQHGHRSVPSWCNHTCILSRVRASNGWPPHFVAPAYVDPSVPFWPAAQTSV